MTTIDKAIKETLQPLNSSVKIIKKVVGGLGKEFLEREGSRAKQPWSTIKKVTDLIERSQRKR